MTHMAYFFVFIDISVEKLKKVNFAKLRRRIILFCFRFEIFVQFGFYQGAYIQILNYKIVKIQNYRKIEFFRLHMNTIEFLLENRMGSRRIWYSIIWSSQILMIMIWLVCRIVARFEFLNWNISRFWKFVRLNVRPVWVIFDILSPEIKFFRKWKIFRILRNKLWFPPMYVLGSLPRLIRGQTRFE